MKKQPLPDTVKVAKGKGMNKKPASILTKMAEREERKTAMPDYKDAVKFERETIGETIAAVEAETGNIYIGFDLISDKGKNDTRGWSLSLYFSGETIADLRQTVLLFAKQYAVSEVAEGTTL